MTILYIRVMILYFFKSKVLMESFQIALIKTNTNVNCKIHQCIFNSYFSGIKKRANCYRKQFSYRLAIDEMKLLGEVSGF